MNSVTIIVLLMEDKLPWTAERLKLPYWINPIDHILSYWNLKYFDFFPKFFIILVAFVEVFQKKKSNNRNLCRNFVVKIVLKIPNANSEDNCTLPTSIKYCNRWVHHDSRLWWARRRDSISLGNPKWPHVRHLLFVALVFLRIV